MMMTLRGGVRMMNNKNRLLSRKERAYILEKISDVPTFTESFKELTKKEEDELISSIVGKLQAGVDLEKD